jgi:hypothetical protein
VRPGVSAVLSPRDTPGVPSAAVPLMRPLGARPVLTTEIFAFAKRSCKRCSGRGSVLWNHCPQPCNCAVRRFLTAHGEELDVDEAGDVWWKDEKSAARGLLAGLDLLILLLQVLLRPLPRARAGDLQQKPPNPLN